MIVDLGWLLVVEVAGWWDESIFVKFTDCACDEMSEGLDFVFVDGYDPAAEGNVSRFRDVSCFTVGEEKTTNSGAFGVADRDFPIEGLIHGGS